MGLDPQKELRNKYLISLNIIQAVKVMMWGWVVVFVVKGPQDIAPYFQVLVEIRDL